MESGVLRSRNVNSPLGEASNYDEVLMQHSLNFADSLKDLKNLQQQLYSAAEYFELSYRKDDHKQLVIETFKEYTTKALVSTVDHLGSAACKLNDFLKEKADEVSATKLRFSCIERRLQSCQEFIDLSGHSQQSLVLATPKHHKRYMITAGKFVCVDGVSSSLYKGSIFARQENLCRTKQAFQASRSQSLPLPRRYTSRPLSSTESSPSSSTFSFTTNTSDRDQGRRSVSPFRFALKRSGSVVSRSTSPSSSNSNLRAPAEPRRATMRRVNQQRNDDEEMELYSRKSKHLLKALLSIHRAKRDGAASRFRDER